MKTLIPLLLLLLVGCQDKPLPSPAELSNRSFNAGAMLGYGVRAWGGTKDDLELMMKAFMENRPKEIDHIMNRLENHK